MLDESPKEEQDHYAIEENQIISPPHAKPAAQANTGGPEPKKRSHRLFLDDTEYTSFVRRLSFSPDGNFMLCPGAWYQDLSAQSTSDKF